MAPGLGAEDAVLLRLNEAVHKLTVKTEELHRLVVKLADKAPEPVAKIVVAAWNKYLAKYEVIQSRLALVPWLGRPSALWDAASRWSEHVGGPVNGLAGYATYANAEVDDYFTGRAGTAYKNMLPAHSEALKAVKAPVSDTVNGALSKIATAIMTCYLAILAAILALVAAVIVAVASSGSGTPAIVGAAAVGVGAIATALGKLRSDIMEASGEIAKASFPGKNWPTTTLPSA